MWRLGCTAEVCRGNAKKKNEKNKRNWCVNGNWRISCRLLFCMKNWESPGRSEPPLPRRLDMGPAENFSEQKGWVVSARALRLGVRRAGLAEGLKTGVSVPVGMPGGVGWRPVTKRRAEACTAFSKCSVRAMKSPLAIASASSEAKLKIGTTPHHTQTHINIVCLCV